MIYCKISSCVLKRPLALHYLYLSVSLIYQTTCTYLFLLLVISHKNSKDWCSRFTQYKNRWCSWYLGQGWCLVYNIGCWPTHKRIIIWVIFTKNIIHFALCCFTAILLSYPTNKRWNSCRNKMQPAVAKHSVCMVGLYSFQNHLKYISQPEVAFLTLVQHNGYTNSTWTAACYEITV